MQEMIQFKMHCNEDGIYPVLHSVQDQTDYVQSEKYPESEIRKSTHKSLLDIHEIYCAW